MINKAKAAPKRVVFPEGEEDKILRSVQVLFDEKIVVPILIGDDKVIREKAKTLNIDLRGTEIINPRKSEKLNAYSEILFAKRQRKGMTFYDARRRLQEMEIISAPSWWNKEMRLPCFPASTPIILMSSCRL